MRFQLPPADRCADAALLGFVAGLRSMTPFAILALHDRLPGPTPLRWLALAAGAGELVGDKLPATPPRTSPTGLAGRLPAGALAGAVAAGPTGAGIGAAAALIGSFAGQYARAGIGNATGLPDPAVAVAEDALALGLAETAIKRLG